MTSSCASQPLKHLRYPWKSTERTREHTRFQPVPHEKPLRPTDVTICIAAAATDRSGPELLLLLCSDKRIEYWHGGAEILEKRGWAGYNWPALMAGDMGRATNLLAKYRQHLRDRTDSLEDHTIIDVLSEPPRIMRRNLIEAHIHSRTALRSRNSWRGARAYIHQRSITALLQSWIL